MPWFLYLLECRNGAYYAGITNNLESRFAAHLSGKGARYTRANPPIRILASKGYPNRSSASSAEAQLKKRKREQKLSFFESDTN
jgi:putative endonuclease